ncbi:MAG: phosphoglycerate kinase [Methanobacteriaceae archaeon]
MALKFYTIDNFHLEDKTVLLRVDINSPVDPVNEKILDDTRIRLHSETIKEIARKGAKTVILAHQSRPGKNDFTTLEQHAQELEKILNMNVEYVDDIFGSNAQNRISQMKKGDILLLENVRFYSEEVLKREPSLQARTHMVQNLSKSADFFINDAFAAAHRSQPSLVGFAYTLPSGAGRIMEKELNTLNSALESVKRPCVYVLGGVKVDDSVMVIENVLKKGSADCVLTTGVVANIFLAASGKKIGKPNYEFIESKGYIKCIKKAKELLKEYKDQIKIPVDVAICKENKREDIKVKKIPNYPIYDIGLETIKMYAQIIRDAKTIFANGPAGVFENEEFSLGTDDILNAIASSEGFSIIGGGHLAAAVSRIVSSGSIDHISSGGGACINLLAGEKLPVVEVLQEVTLRYGDRKVFK